MISTGIAALDDRLGGLNPGAVYCAFGAESAGKSVLGLHFLLDGLARGERCALLTREAPDMIDSRARYAGHSLGRVSVHRQLTIVRMPARLPGLALVPGAALTRWLGEQLERIRPARVVFDACEALADYSDQPSSLLGELAAALKASGALSYVLVRTDQDANIDAEAYGALLGHAAAVFRLQTRERGERRFLFHSAPPGAFRTDPFRYSLRIGAGFTEELTLDTTALDPADRRRVIVLDELGVLPGEVLSGLSGVYELEVLSTTAGALGRLSAGRYGALVLVVDPFDEARAFDLVFALRKEGNAAPIVFAASSRGLRDTTRARALRVGGDDFFVTELPPTEILDRVQQAWQRGSHSRSGPSQISQIIQPVNGDGLARPMTPSEFTQAVSALLEERPPLFFCYLEFALPDSVADVVWPALRSRVRLSDGDIIGQLSSRRFACVLDRITAEQTRRVVDRIRAGHPVLRALEDVVVIASPAHREALRERLGGIGAATPEEPEALAGGH